MIKLEKQTIQNERFITFTKLIYTFTFKAKENGEKLCHSNLLNCKKP